jgi:putative FmdB family regulatory protein
VPTYQYACTECGEPLEVVQSFTDDALTVCPTCGGRLRKLYGGVGIVFKGSGFYRNDSRATSSSSEPASAGSGTKAESGKDSGKDSAKPAGSDKPAAAAASSEKSGGSSTTSTSKSAKTGSDTSAA